MAELPTAPNKNQVITSAFLKAVVKALIRNIRGGRGINVKPVGQDILLELSGRQIIPAGGGAPFFFPAIITGSTTLGSTGARWKYAWQEVELDGDSYAVKSGGRSGTTGAAAGSDLGYALNLNEMTITTAKSGTTAWYVDGVQANSTTASSAYPTGFAPRPIGGGGTSGTHKLNALVWMRDTTDKNGVRIFRFAAKLSHDGTCT